MNHEEYEAASNLVIYNPDSGQMVWKARNNMPSWNAKHALKDCGTIDSYGYKQITFNLGAVMKGKRRSRTRAHQLAWFIHYGRPPEGQIDHINQDKLDNRISNLRDVTNEINQRNRPMNKNNKSGVTGVYFDRGKWQAVVCVSCVRISVGRYDEISEAEKAIKDFRQKNGFTEQHGKLQKYTKTQQNKQR